MKELTCIVCPLGCTLLINTKNNNFVITGNGCKRGEVYAREELTCPKRVVTSTVLCRNGEMLSVKTDKGIPKEKVPECMQIIKKHIADLPILCGDVIIENIFDSNIVATDNMC